MSTESVESYANRYIGIVKLIQISFYGAKLQWAFRFDLRSSHFFSTGVCAVIYNQSAFIIVTLFKHHVYLLQSTIKGPFARRRNSVAFE